MTETKGPIMTLQLGQTVHTQTQTGVVAGRIVGTEDRDVSRHGDGQPQLFLCVALPDPFDEWKWFPAHEVTA